MSDGLSHVLTEVSQGYLQPDAGGANIPVAEGDLSEFTGSYITFLYKMCALICWRALWRRRWRVFSEGSNLQGSKRCSNQSQALTLWRVLHPSLEPRQTIQSQC